MNVRQPAAWTLVALLPWVVDAAATGRVLDPDGHPIVGAEACTFNSEGVQTACVKVDAAGYYRMQEPTRRTVLVRASGFVPVEAEAIEQPAPITLARAATLLVKVVDAATGKPVPSGKVILNYSSGQRVGSTVPFNKNGVRITTLLPGEILARAEAAGYEPGGPEPVKAEGGVEKTVTIGMRRKASTRP